MNGSEIDEETSAVMKKIIGTLFSPSIRHSGTVRSNHRLSFSFHRKHAVRLTACLRGTFVVVDNK